MKLHPSFPLITALLSLAVGAPIDAAQTASVQLSPYAVDLSELVRSPVPQAIKRIQFETIDNKMGSVELMLGAYPRRAGDPDILSGNKQNEASLLAANRQVAVRTGDTLTIRRKNDKNFVFRSWSKPGGVDHEGDGETFVYGGSLGNSGYQMVDAAYIHDSPGTFLLGPGGGDALFVQSGSDRVSVSKDKERLMVMTEGSYPAFGMMVVGLTPNGHRLEMRCQGSRDKLNSPKIIPFFTGWHVSPFIGFDVVLLVQQLGPEVNTRYEAIPVRFSAQNLEWHISVPEPLRFARSANLACWQ